jgi:glycine hydroxymethyltransferase
VDDGQARWLGAGKGNEMTVDIRDIEKIVAEQQSWRGEQCINLIASENVQSKAVREIQGNDFMARYAEGKPNQDGQINRYYQGTRFIDKLELMAQKEAAELFDCLQVDIRPYSGNNANAAIALAFLKAGDTIIVNSTDAGGHISHNNIGVFGRRIQIEGKSLTPSGGNAIPLYHWPLTEDGYHIDVAAAVSLIDKVRPKLVILGKSVFLFPEPLKEISNACTAYGTPVLYDAAHVLGLIAGGTFQDPLREGATWVTGSTHKTFPGPQRGLILSNLSNEESIRKYWMAAERGVFPGTSSNHHLYSLPAMLITIREMKRHGKSYASQIIKNAKTLASELDAHGICIEAKEFGFTESHIVLANVSNKGGGVNCAQALEDANIITNFNMIPGDEDPRKPSGLRIGTAEMTRYGMQESEMSTIAWFIDKALKGKNVKDEVVEFRSRFREVHFC